MHMANELLSVPVATGMLAIAAAGIGFICQKAGKLLESEKLALMGVLGAFVFAAQMVNFQLPLMPGTSGHLLGAVLLAIILGPHAAAIVLSSVVIVQCLIFQDGGLLALGCNIINIAIAPTYIGYALYRWLTRNNPTGLYRRIAVIVACIVAVEIPAVLIPIQAALSGVLMVPLRTFALTMLSVHVLVGIMEGLVTIAVIEYLHQVRPDMLDSPVLGKARLSRKTVLITVFAVAVVAGAGLSVLASRMPDGLEWSYAERPDQPDFKPIVSNTDNKIATVEKFQARYSVFPDYSRRNAELGAINETIPDNDRVWTSFAAVVGSVATMILVWLVAVCFSRPRLAG